MNVSLISKYRSQLMGVAILMVALFHSSIVHANDWIDMCCFIGDMGVDLFFLLSGFGMFYTFLKKPNWKTFYWKRCLRIVPAWFLVNLLVQYVDIGIRNMDWLSFLKYITGFSFWLDGNLYFWYIPTQLAFYLVTPLFMKYYSRDKKKAYGGLSLIWIAFLGASILCHNAKYFIFLFRWPVYFIGIYLGELAYQKQEIKKSVLGIMGVFLITGLAIEYAIKHLNGNGVVRYDYKYFVYVMVAIPLAFLLPMLFEKVSYSFSVCKFLGAITLEIYLLHEFLLRKVTMCVEKIPFDSLGIVFNILVFIATIFIAWMFHNLLSLLLDRLQKKNR